MRGKTHPYATLQKNLPWANQIVYILYLWQPIPVIAVCLSHKCEAAGKKAEFVNGLMLVCFLTGFFGGMASIYRYQGNFCR